MSGKIRTFTTRLLLSIFSYKLHTPGQITGLSRSLLAAGMLLTLMFNDINFIIPRHYLNTLDLHSLKYKCNFFLLLNTLHLSELQILAIVILLFVLSGYFIKITSFLQFWITASFFMLRPPFFAEGDGVNMLLSLLLVPVCLCDDRKNHWEEDIAATKLNASIQKIFLFIIKLQVAFIYFDSVYSKLQLKEWRSGTVIYYWFTHNFFGLHPLVSNTVEPVLRNLPIINLIIAWGSLLFEILLFTGLFLSSGYKLLLLKAGVIFHLCIMLIHGYASFFFVMSAGLFMYLYPTNYLPVAKIAYYESNSLDYVETNQLPFNEYLMFFTYVFLFIMIANILPVTTFTYYLSLAFGIIGIFILLLKFTYSLLINNIIIQLLIKIPFKLSLLKLQVNEIENADELQFNALNLKGSGLKKNYRVYIFGDNKGIKITLKNEEVIIISGINIDDAINRVNKIRSEKSSSLKLN